MRKKVAAALIVFAASPAAADCRMEPDGLHTGDDGMPAQYRLQCDDGSTGYGQVDSSGHFTGTLIPTIVPRGYRGPTEIEGYGAGNHHYEFHPIGPPAAEDDQ